MQSTKKAFPRLAVLNCLVTRKWSGFSEKKVACTPDSLSLKLKQPLIYTDAVSSAPSESPWKRKGFEVIIQHRFCRLINDNITEDGGGLMSGNTIQYWRYRVTMLKGRVETSKLWKKEQYRTKIEENELNKCVYWLRLHFTFVKAKASGFKTTWFGVNTSDETFGSVFETIRFQKPSRASPCKPVVTCAEVLCARWKGVCDEPRDRLRRRLCKREALTVS